MITINNVVDTILYHDNPTLIEFFGIDVRGLDKFVKPETDILSLVMLAKARDQGLDTVFVDQEEFFDGTLTQIKGELLNGTGPFDGAWYIEFELAPALLHGKRFSLIDYSESMGYGVTIGSANFVNELIRHFLKASGKVDYGDWQEENVKTIEQLAGYINRMLTLKEPKETWYNTKLPTTYEVLTYGAIPFIGIAYGVHYLFKYINKFFRYINDLWNKPL